MSDDKDENFVELRYARNSYNSAVAAAAGFVSGRRVESLKMAEKRLRKLLWDNRDALIARALPES